MTYVNALKYLASLSENETNIERAHKVCELLSSSEERVRNIHVIGKQGKNSCHRMLSSILTESGLTVGGFSPSHAIEPRDAITVNGRPVSYETFSETIEEIKLAYPNAALGSPSTDEVLCLAATVIFDRMSCDLAIFEKDVLKADAVNMTATPILAIASSMGELDADELDLTETLRRGTGETVTSPQHKAIYNALSQGCARIGSRLTLAIYSELEITKINLFKTSFSYLGNEYSIRSFSPYQTVNAITVIEAANALIRLGLPIAQEHISSGIAKATFPYKCEAVSLEPTIIINSSSEIGAVSSLAASIAQVSEHIEGKIFVAMDGSYSEGKEKLSEILSAYGILPTEIVTVSPELTSAKLKRTLAELIAPLTSDESMSSALILIAKKELAARLSEAARQILGRI